MRRADRLVERGKLREAISTLQSALRFGADPCTCHLRLAKVYQTRRQWPEALSAAEMAISADPARLAAREALITLCLDSRDYNQAIAASHAVLRMSPRHIGARDAIGAAYVGLGDLPAAMRMVNDLIRLDPSDAAHRLKKALLCQHQNEFELSVEEYERVIEMAPDTETAETARQQLDQIDGCQIQSIFALSAEDPLFRTKILHDVNQALRERGFHLSELGRLRLLEVCHSEWEEADLDWSPKRYH